jgi:hypothetical protein
MANAQRRAVQNYRNRLAQRGLVRFEVLGLDEDRTLVRSLARRLAEDGPAAEQIRAMLRRTMAGEAPRKGGILAALRRSPLVGAEIDLERPRVTEREIDL